MSVVGAIATLTPGAAVQLNPPQPSGIESVQIDNLSTYLLVISVGGDQFYLDPLCSGLFITGPAQPVNVTAVQLPGDVSTSGAVAPTWFFAGETPDPSAYPVALSGPAQVAAATAAALLTNGVPSTLIVNPIYSNTFPPAIAAGQVIPIDATNYATLLITAGRITSSPAGVTFEIDWYADAARTYLIGSEILGHPNLDGIRALGSAVTYTVPVLSRYANITAITGMTTLNVIGLNRILTDRIRLNKLTAVPRNFYVSANAAAGSQNLMNDTLGLDNRSYVSGHAMCVLNTNTAGNLNIEYVNYADPAGSFINVTLFAASASGVYNLDLGLPAVPIRWYFSPYAAAPSLSVGIIVAKKS